MDAIDNCKAIPNSDQKDWDLDKVGNACDPDMDGDGVDNQFDNCPVRFNRGQEDLTETQIGGAADGVGDTCDLCPADFSPGNGDLDGDGIGDVCDRDIDGDGVAKTTTTVGWTSTRTSSTRTAISTGAACDDDDFAGILNRPWEVVVVNGFERFPMPVCTGCPASPYLTPGFESVINVQLPADYQSRIVDTEGTSPARARSTARYRRYASTRRPMPAPALPGCSDQDIAPARVGLPSIAPRQI